MQKLSTYVMCEQSFTPQEKLDDDNDIEGYNKSFYMIVTTYNVSNFFEIVTYNLTE